MRRPASSHVGGAVGEFANGISVTDRGAGCKGISGSSARDFGRVLRSPVHRPSYFLRNTESLGRQLVLPPRLIQALGLRWYSFGRAIMADGTITIHDIYLGKIEWDGRIRRVRVNELDATPLVGMALMRGCELRIRVQSRGAVTVKRLPRRR